MAERKVSRRLIGATAITAAAGGVVLYAVPDAPAFGETVAGPLLQATAVSPQPTSTSAQPTPPAKPLRFYPGGPAVRPYYALVDGPRTMGQAISPLLRSTGSRRSTSRRRAWRTSGRTTAPGTRPTTSSTGCWWTR